LEETIIYPYICKMKVEKVFVKEISVTLNSGLTTFIGPNGVGKTQTLKTLRDYLKNKFGNDKVRYLSSNRIGQMEQYRSRINQYTYSTNDYQMGDRGAKEARHQIETAAGDFFTMDERKDVYIKVAERLSVLFNRHIYLRWDAGQMKVFFGKTYSKEEYSIVMEASGLVNVISVLAALFDEEIKFLLIDEPEVSLHPQLQSYLLREMKNAIRNYGKTIILSTHSTEMISFDSVRDITSMVFFTEKNEPIQISVDAPELQGKKLQDFLYRMGQTYKNGFFAKKILLLEGVSDMIICDSLASKLQLNIDVAGSQIIPVDGKGQFPIIVKLFRLINKEVAVLTDLDGFVDDNSIIDLFVDLPQAIELANRQGNASVSDVVRGIKTKISELAVKHKEDMIAIYEKHPYWIIKSQDEEDIKFVKRALIGELFCNKEEVVQGWPDASEWVTIKCRLEALFTMLRAVGCFVLTKGAIESYYLYSLKTTYSEKPSVAVEEMSNLGEFSVDQVEENYKDIIFPLKHIALINLIDESLAVKKVLLSELALVLGILNEQTTEEEIYAVIKQVTGNQISLFDYHVINLSGKLGVEIELHSKIMDVEGFPFQAFVGENVNEIVKLNVKRKN